MKSVRELQGLLAWTVGVTILLIVPVCALASHLIYNRTASLPIGWYWVERSVKPVRGDMVAFPVPVSVKGLVHERRYLPDGAYLVKMVVGMAGDFVCMQDGVFTVNDAVVGSVLTTDSAGRALPRVDVCEQVAPGEIYVASGHPRSFDSRAFGAVKAAEIRGKVTRLWAY